MSEKEETDRMPITLRGRIVGTAICYDNNTIHGVVYSKKAYEHLMEHNVPWQFDTLSLDEKEDFDVDLDVEVPEESLEVTHNIFDSPDPSEDLGQAKGKRPW